MMRRWSIYSVFPHAGVTIRIRVQTLKWGIRIAARPDRANAKSLRFHTARSLLLTAIALALAERDHKRMSSSSEIALDQEVNG